MSNRVSLNDIAEKFALIDNALVLTHEKPDGDAVGSVLALINYFNDNNKNAFAFFPEKLPQNYNSFVNIKNVYIENFPSDIKFKKIICLDSGNYKRLGVNSFLKNKIQSEKIFNIDHHFDNELYGNVNYIDSAACSACEILFDIFKLIKPDRISPKTANYILLGILMDTGGFRFDNTNSAVLRKTSELIENGADYLSLVKTMFFKKQYNHYRMECDIALNHLRWEYENKFVYTYLSPEILEKYKVNLKEIEGLIDSFRILEGVEVAALITKRGDGFKISLRSNNPDYSVVDVAHKLNGGGHRLAAGCFVAADSFDKAEKVLLPLIKEILIPPQ